MRVGISTNVTAKKQKPPKHCREAAQNVTIVEVSIRGDTDCTQGVSTWLANKRAGDMFPNLIFFRKPLKNVRASRGLEVFRHAEFENAIHFFFNKFEILLVLIFNIHSHAEIFLDRMNYAHTLLDFRQRRGLKNFAPIKDSVTIITLQAILYTFVRY